MPVVHGAYYPSWRIYKGLPPSALQANKLTHVFYAFLGLNQDGTLRPLDEHADRHVAADGAQGCLAALAKLKHHNPHLKTLVSIGGGSSSDAFAPMAADPHSRSTFILACRAFIDQWALDGVDIDWEHPLTPEQGADYDALLRDLRAVLPSPRYLLTSALPVGEYCLRHIDLAAAGRLLDLVNLMGYDFTGEWTAVSGHQAQLRPPPAHRLRGDEDAALRTSCTAAVEYVLSRGFPAAKLVLGIPAYARYFAGAGGVGQSFAGTEELDYCELPLPWVDGADVDHEVCAASFVGREEGFRTFDVPETVRVKAGFVRERGMAGLFYWTGVGDAAPGPRSLVSAGWEVLCAGGAV